MQNSKAATDTQQLLGPLLPAVGEGAQSLFSQNGQELVDSNACRMQELPLILSNCQGGHMGID